MKTANIFRQSLSGLRALSEGRAWQSLLGALGIGFTVAASYAGFVVVPDRQVSGLKPVLVEPNRAYPSSLNDAERRGKEVYVSLGCIYCHSQQVRQGDFGKDISRGWGRRASVPLDYALEGTPLLGTMRTGPDLRNIGTRQPSEAWHYLHLYNPRIVSPGSVMPPFRFLFRTVEKDRSLNRPLGWVDVPRAFAPPGKYVATTRAAEDLVAYLKSLRHDDEVPRAPMKSSAEDGRGDAS